MVKDGVDGLLYDYKDPAMLAWEIDKVFCDDAMASGLSQNGRKAALIRHDRKLNANKMNCIYNELISGI